MCMCLEQVFVRWFDKIILRWRSGESVRVVAVVVGRDNSMSQLSAPLALSRFMLPTQLLPHHPSKR